MKRTFSMLARLLIWFLLLAPIFQGMAGEPEPFFPIMAWDHVPNDLPVLNKIHECGFTVAGFVKPETLKNCRRAGLKAIVQDRRTYGYNWNQVDKKVARENVLSLVKQVGKDPTVFGYYLRDEPSSRDFGGLATVASLVEEMNPGKWPYINLLPNYANNEQLGSSSYEEHLESFIAACHPTILSYDHYAIMDDGSLRASYWQNLEQMRAAAQKHDLPFWNIILSVAHFNYREATAADLRFQVYSSLLCGARGIAYFKYFAPNVGNFRMAPIDQFGHPTKTWSDIQNVNLQVQKLAPTLLELTSDSVYHFGAVPQGCHEAPVNSLVSEVDTNFACGDFTHRDGRRFVMLINKDVLKSHVCQPKYRNPPKKVMQISPYTGTAIPYWGEHVWASPGQGILLSVE